MKIDNNHRFSNRIYLNIIIILMLNFSYISDNKASDTPFQVKIDDVRCYGESNGSIEIIPSKEISESFTIEIRSKVTGILATFNENLPKPFQVSDLKSGEYVIWYTIGTSKEKISVTIESPEILKANVISIESASGENESLRASLKANPTGGTSPYTITWSENTNNQQGETATDLPLGIYKCIIDDSKGCGPVSATYFLAESEIEKFRKEISEK